MKKMNRIIKNKITIEVLILLVMTAATIFIVKLVSSKDNPLEVYRYNAPVDLNTKKTDSIAKKMYAINQNMEKVNYISESATKQSSPKVTTKSAHMRSVISNYKAIPNNNTENYIQSQSPAIENIANHKSARFQRDVDIKNVQHAQNLNSASNVQMANASTSSKSKSSVQKVGGKPAEPGLGSLPVGDGVWILLTMAGLFTLLKFKF